MHGVESVSEGGAPRLRDLTSGSTTSLGPASVSQPGRTRTSPDLADPAAEDALACSLRRFGPLAPVTACVRAGRLELLDGFKRRLAAWQLGWPTVSGRVLEVDERQAKAALFGLNSVGRRPQEVEEAWIVQALVRADGLSQVEVAALLGRHKSWVCRRLALLERLGPEVPADLRLGLLSPGLARPLTRLPVGNQAAVLTSARRASLTLAEVQGVIGLLRGATPEVEADLLHDPRAALQRAEGVPLPVRDARLSPAGNRLARQLGLLLDVLGRLDHWLEHPGLAELKYDDRRLLASRFAQLARVARTVAHRVDELGLIDLPEVPA